MKKIIFLCLALAVLLVGQAWAQVATGHISERTCEICGKWFEMWVPDGFTFNLSQKIWIDGNIRSHPVYQDIILCKYCESLFREPYLEAMKDAKNAFIVKCKVSPGITDRIKQNEKDNAIRQEKQEKIRELQEEIWKLQYGQSYRVESATTFWYFPDYKGIK